MKRWVVSVLLLVPFGVPARAAEERAMACPRHGPGFVEVPGTATCIRLGGRVVSGYATAGRRPRREDVAGFGASASVSADIRSDTAYGPLRAYVRTRVGSGDGFRRP